MNGDVNGVVGGVVNGDGAGIVVRPPPAAQGLRRMVAVIGDSAHRPSIVLHERAGFVRVGTLRDIGFKFGRPIDPVILQRPFGPGGGTLPDEVPPPI
jgi:phosphinothricin acetyltransferase